MSLTLKLSCKKHPRYKMVKDPTRTKTDCACYAMYIADIGVVNSLDFERLKAAVTAGHLRVTRL